MHTNSDCRFETRWTAIVFIVGFLAGVVVTMLIVMAAQCDGRKIEPPEKPIIVRSW